MEKHNVMILDNHPKISRLYAVGLETYTGCGVTFLNDVQEGEDYIQNFCPSIAIVRGMIEQRDVASICYNIINNNASETKLIILGKSGLSSHHAAILDGSPDVSTVIKTVAKLLDIKAKDMVNQDVGDFYPFKLENLFPRLELTCDIFTPSNGNTSPTLFLTKGSVISSEIITILEHQNHTRFFVRAEERLKFVNTMMVHLSDFLADDELNLNDSIMLANKAYQVVRESARKMEISPEVILMAESNINTMISIVKQIPRLSELMEIATESSDEHFTQSLMINYVVNHILSRLEWGTQEQKVKLTFVSFFHNITLPSHLIFYNNEKDLIEANIPPQSQQRVMKHALQAAKIVSKFKSRIPLGVDTIIKQHHGSRDGTSFSKYPLSISPLAIVFMIADDLVSTQLVALKQGKEMSTANLRSPIRDRYKGQVYDKILETLQDLA